MTRNLKRMLCSLAAGCLAFSAQAVPIKALIVDGQNNHDWKGTTPVLKKILEETQLFAVDVATTPGPKKDMSGFGPKFSDYQVVVLNYTGDSWPKEAQTAFVKFVREGGGVVVFHAANNAFPEWKEFNEMIAVGGWGGRNEKTGPYLRLRDRTWSPVQAPGPGGSHGAQHDFVMETQSPDHPVMKGLPPKWVHLKDELYDRLRGPAQNVTVLASAFSAKEKGGSGENEPLLMAISFGQGRIFHDGLGHGPEAMKCVGFIVTLQRGTEWAATGKVTQKIPEDFPTANKVSVRK
jgi:uncharacterized protein